MKFKEFFKVNKMYRGIFENTLDKLYDRGYFGEIPKEQVVEGQGSWFMKFVALVEQKEEIEIILALCNNYGKENCEWFTEMTGINVKNKTNKEIRSLISEYCKD